jgi:protein-S-isoprenylcysteine O-methyltransferase Ste14
MVKKTKKSSHNKIKKKYSKKYVISIIVLIILILILLFSLLFPKLTGAVVSGGQTQVYSILGVVLFIVSLILLIYVITRIRMLKKYQ